MELTETAPPLKVLFKDQLVGELIYDLKKNDFHFSYSTTWLQGKDSFPLSPHIPFDKEPVSGSVSRFLENLLPEGPGLKDLAQSLKIPTNNLYALIAAIGQETTGAFTISQTGKTSESQFRLISHTELAERIHERKSRPITIWDGRPRLSVAGVQAKLPILIKDGQYGLGEGHLASTHILKFGNDEAPHLVLNELFCMKLAKAIGLPVAECELVDFSERVLQVQRFDRTWVNKNCVERHHIIDGCQALDISPSYKYQRFLGDSPATALILGPANLENLYRFCQDCKVPAKAQLHLLQWVFFNLIIGNCDHHIKNISYSVSGNGITIAPAYDLLNITVYQNFEQALAFRIGDTFELNEVNDYQLAELAISLDLKTNFVGQQMAKICKSTLEKIENLDFSEITLSKEEQQFLKNLKENILARATKLLNFAPNVKKFRSLEKI